MPDKFAVLWINRQDGTGYPTNVPSHPKLTFTHSCGGARTEPWCPHPKLSLY